MVYDSIKGRNAPNILYTKDECVAFRQSFQIPMPTMIWIGRFDEVNRDMSKLDFSREVDGDRLTGNVMTLTNEHFVAQVLSLHPPQISTGAPYIGVEQKQGEWDLALTQIWPPANATVNWPPPASSPMAERAATLISSTDGASVQSQEALSRNSLPSQGQLSNMPRPGKTLQTPPSADRGLEFRILIGDGTEMALKKHLGVGLSCGRYLAGTAIRCGASCTLEFVCCRRRRTISQLL
jgi:hypothetical protein